MRELDAAKVDAFTTTPYTGNIAGVVLDADGLDERQMQRIAREMNVSETAFLMAPSAEGATMRLRYFTPTWEIPLCGHATIAAFHLLAERGLLKTPARVALETGAGVLDVEVRADGEVYLSSDPLTYEPSPWDRASCARALGLPATDVTGDALVVSKKLFVPVAGLKAMAAMRPDLPAIAALRERFLGVVPVSMETGEKGHLTRIRFFAPGIGIDEDPVTGTAHMALAGFLARSGRLSLPARFVGEQGHECGRPGLVSVEADGPADALRVRVGGRAVTTLAGRLRAP